MGLVCKEADRPKPKVSLAEREREARELGLSFGMYMAYLETGYITKYRKDYKRRKFREALQHGTVIKSNIIGG